MDFLHKVQEFLDDDGDGHAVDDMYRAGTAATIAAAGYGLGGPLGGVGAAIMAGTGSFKHADRYAHQRGDALEQYFKSQGHSAGTQIGATAGMITGALMPGGGVLGAMNGADIGAQIGSGDPAHVANGIAGATNQVQRSVGNIPGLALAGANPFEGMY